MPGVRSRRRARLFKGRLVSLGNLEDSAWYKELRVGGDATVPYFHNVDEFCQYRDTGNPRVDLGAPMYCGHCAVDQHGENYLFTQFKALNHDREQRAKFADPDRSHRDWTRVIAGTGHLKIGIIRKCGAHRGEVAAHPGSIEFEQQTFDFDALRHSVILQVRDN
jgi:hypothetical protein